MSKNKNPLVSIILPTYNRAATLGWALQSIAEQTYRNFETILIDNNCTDNTLEVAKEYQSSTNLKILSCEIQGCAPACNVGIYHSKGSLIARQDDDDYWYPTKLEKQVKFLEKNPSISILGTQVRIIDDNKRPIFDYEIRTDSLSGRFTPPKKKPTEDHVIKKEFLMGKCPIINPSVVIKKEKLLYVGGYDHIFTRNEDLLLWLRLIPWCNFANLDEILMDYTSRPNNDNPHVPFVAADMHYQLYKALGIVSGERPPLNYK
tara:strand:- start:1169 stop:1951 length:783 start_codon:yes stop_codon:yes gene_type:complete